MTDNNYTHITLVADRSGSMFAVQADAQGAINGFIDEQKEVEGKATLLLIDFDAPERGYYSSTLNGPQWHKQHVWNVEADAKWYRQVFKGPIKLATKYLLEPRGNTALNDAIGRAIVDTGKYLADMTENERPGKVVFVTQTDGGENSSREYTLDAVKALVQEQTDKYKWEFVFLGMGLDVASQGHAYGFQHVASAVANTGMTQRSMYSNLSGAVGSYRGGNDVAMAAAAVDIDEDGTITQR